MRAIVLWSALVRAGRVLRCRALEYWNTGVLEYWSWREGSEVQPATERFRSRVRVGMAGPGRRPSARQCALVPSGARRPLLRCRVLAYWSTGVLQYVGCALGSGSGPAPQCASSCQFPRVPGNKWQHVKISCDDTFHPGADRGS